MTCQFGLAWCAQADNIPRPRGPSPPISNYFSPPPVRQMIAKAVLHDVAFNEVPTRMQWNRPNIRLPVTGASEMEFVDSGLGTGIDMGEPHIAQA